MIGSGFLCRSAAETGSGKIYIPGKRNFGKDHSMKSIISKTTSVILALLTAISIFGGTTVTAIGAVNAPKLKAGFAYGDKLEIKVENTGDYTDGTKFEVVIGEKVCKTVKLAKLKENDSVIKLNADADNYFKPETSYTVKVRAVCGNSASSYKSVTMTTAEKTYYKISKGEQLYSIADGKVTKAETAKTKIYSVGVLSDSNGSACKGKSVSEHKAEYVKLTSGEHKGLYALKENVTRVKEETITKNKPAKPEFSAPYISSNKIRITLDNLSDYSGSTKFAVSVDGVELTTVSLDKLKDCNSISITSADGKYLKKETAYKIKVTARKYDLTCSTSKTLTTGSYTYYKVSKGTQLYELNDSGKFKKADTADYKAYYKGVTASENGKTNAGKSTKTCKTAYIKLSSGDCKGLYVAADDTERATEETVKSYERQQKINKVVDYAMSNVGGRYVSCGTSYRATDCSGLTMLAYRQIGVELPHSAYGQMQKGTRVSASQMQPGDIIVANGYNHAMMYVGNGYVVHAMNWRDGIKMQKASTAMYYNPVNCIVRII